MRTAEVTAGLLWSHEDGKGYRRSDEVTCGLVRSHEFNRGHMRLVKIERGRLMSQKGCLGPMRMATVKWGWLRPREITWCQMSSAKVWEGSLEVGWGHMGLHEVGLGQMRSQGITKGRLWSHVIECLENVIGCVYLEFLSCIFGRISGFFDKRISGRISGCRIRYTARSRK